MAQDNFQFDEEMARRLESVYTTKDAIARRQTVLNVLSPKAGEHIIDIGTGPGFLAYEMAESVGAEGRILAIDKSEPMLQLARRRCRELPWVEFQDADATRLPATDEVFDAAVSIQVIEFVHDIASAIREMYRVLKPGSRALIVCTDWDSIIWHATDKNRMTKILRAFEEHCAHSNLPRTLASSLKIAGFEIQEHRVINQFNVTLDPKSYSGGLLRIIQSFVVGRNGVMKEDVDAWAMDLQQLSDRGEYFFCLNQFLFLACRSERK